MLPTISQEVLEKDALAGVQIAWDMLMIHPPAIACTPKKYTESWHIEYGPHWNKRKLANPLVYFSPVLLLGAGGTIGSKALVGNIVPSKQENHRDLSAEGETLTEVHMLCVYFFIYSRAKNSNWHSLCIVNVIIIFSLECTCTSHNLCHIQALSFYIAMHTCYCQNRVWPNHCFLQS